MRLRFAERGAGLPQLQRIHNRAVSQPIRPAPQGGDHEKHSKISTRKLDARARVHLGPAKSVPRRYHYHQVHRSVQPHSGILRIIGASLPHGPCVNHFVGHWVTSLGPSTPHPLRQKSLCARGSSVSTPCESWSRLLQVHLRWVLNWHPWRCPQRRRGRRGILPMAQ
jgi:hypothetical protein